jgi:hypothetical protein
MRKKALVLGVLALGILLVGVPVMAATTFVGTFPVTADIPPATSVSFVVSQVDVNNHFTSNGSNNLTFPVSLDPDLKIYTPAYTFAIDVATSGGAGNPDVLIQYSNNNNPNGTGPGLDIHGVSTVQKVVGATGDQTVTNLKSATLGDMNNYNVLKTALVGGFMRVLVGLSTGNTNPLDGPIDPPNVIPFTNGDLSGTYTGTLTLTATLP